MGNAQWWRVSIFQDSEHLARDAVWVFDALTFSVIKKWLLLLGSNQRPAD